MDFDPDAFLASPAPQQPPPNQQPAFDPDAYLASPKQPQPNQQPTFDPDAYLASPEKPTSSQLGTAARAAGESAIPTFAGLEAAIPAAGVGTAAGEAIGGALGLPAGPFGVAGGVILGGAVGAGAGYLASKGQDWVMDKLGIRKSLGLDPEQRAVDAEQNPITNWAAGIAPAIASMRPDAAAKWGARALSGGILGTQEAGQEYANTGEVSPGKVAATVAAGALLPRMTTPSSLVRGALFRGTEGRTAITNEPLKQPGDPVHEHIGGAAPPIKGVREPDLIRPNNPGALGLSPEATPPQGETEDQITLGDPGNAPDKAGNQTAPMKERVAADANDPIRRNLLKQPGGALRPGGIPEFQRQEIVTVPTTEGATFGDIPDETLRAPFTPRPNQPGGALRPGIPEVQRMPPAAQKAIQAGQPAQQAPAPQLAPAPQPAPTQPGGALRPQGIPESQQLPKQTGLTPPTDINHPVVRQAVQLAARRPIDTDHDIVSLAIASADPNGPVYIDKDLAAKLTPEDQQFLAIHETVEGELERIYGEKYPPAHDIATAAEKQAVEAAGLDWDKYSATIEGMRKPIEAKKVAPEVYAKMNLASNPYDDIGHYDRGAQVNAENPQEGLPNEEKPVTAAVKPEPLSANDQAYIKLAKGQLERPGFEDELASFNAKPEQEQLALAKDWAEKYGPLAQRTARTGVRPTRMRAGGEEVQVNASRAAREDRSTASIKKATDEFAPDPDKLGVIPETDEDRQDLIDRIHGMVRSAADYNTNGDGDQIKGGGSGSPLRADTGGFKPKKVTAEWSLLDQAEKIAATKNPSDEALAKFVADELTLRTGGDEAAAEFQAGRRTEADIDKRQIPVSEAAQEDMIAKERAKNAPEPIEDLPPFDNSAGNESKVYEGQQKELRDWWNGLRTSQRSLLLDKQPGLLHDVNLTQDPEELLRNYKDALADTGKRPGVIERVPAEDVEGGRVTPLTSAEDIERLGLNTNPDRFEAKTTDHTLSDEDKARIAKEMGLPVAKKPGLTTAARKAMNAAARARAGILPDRTVEEEAAAAKNLDARTIDKKAITGDWGTAYDNVKKMVEDEGGAGPAPTIPQFLKEIIDPQQTTARDAAERLGNRFNEHILGLDNDKSLVNAALASYPKEALDVKGGTKQIYKARENGTTDQLPADLKKANDENIEPFAKLKDADLRELAALNQKHPWLKIDLPKELQPGEDAPVDPTSGEALPKVNAPSGIVKMHVARQRIDQDMYDADTAGTANPMTETGRGLPLFNGALQPRNFKGLHELDANGDPVPGGQRLTFHMDKDGMTILRNGAPTALKNLPPSFAGDIGDQVTLKIKGKNKNFGVDQATADEIEKASGKNQDGTPKIQYRQNAFAAETQAFLGTRAVLRNAKLLIAAKNDPAITNNSTTDFDVAKKLGYVETKLPQMQTDAKGKTIYYDPRIAWSMDDFVRPGIGGTALDPVRNAGNGLMNTMFILNPIVHPLNEAVLWATGRGAIRFATPAAYSRMLNTGVQAMKLVWSESDPQLLANMRAHGANLISPSVISEGLMKRMAQRFGEEALKQPSIFDPLTKAFGTTVPDTLKWMSQNSKKLMWKLSDTLYVQRILENQQEGMSLDAAIQDAGHFISTYRLNPTVLGTTHPLDRAANQILADPAVSMFWRYHGGLFNSMGHVFRTIASAQSTPDQKKMALSQLAMGMIITGAIYPALDKAYQKITGNPNAEVGRRGIATIPYGAYQAYQQSDPTKLISDVFSPSIPLKMGMGAVNNTDPFTGKKIVQPGLGAAHNTVREAEWLARNAIPPINQAEGALSESRGQTVGDRLKAIAQKQGEGLLGLKNPGPKQQRYIAQADKYAVQNRKTASKRPAGWAEEQLYGR